MNELDLHIPFSAPLNEQDTETQTYGCRQRNPDICRNNGIEKVCAFVNDDCICRHVSNAWKKKFKELKAMQEAAKPTI